MFLPLLATTVNIEKTRFYCRITAIKKKVNAFVCSPSNRAHISALKVFNKVINTLD